MANGNEPLTCKPSLVQSANTAVCVELRQRLVQCGKYVRPNIGHHEGRCCGWKGQLSNLGQTTAD